MTIEEKIAELDKALTARMQDLQRGDPQFQFLIGQKFALEQLLREEAAKSETST